MRGYKFCSFYKGWYKPVLTLELGSYFSPYPQIHFSLGYGQWFINIPYNTGRDECENPQYGFYLYGEGQKLFDSLWLCYGMKRKCIYMPWSYDWYRTSTIIKDNTWFNETKKNRLNWSGKEDGYGSYNWLQKNSKKEIFPYTYILKGGNIQNLSAEVKVEEREWRQKWLKWTSLFNKTRKTIAIEFSEEVGEGKGSWKGGTVGCSFELLSNETPEQCLRRMEKERKFER